MGLGLLAVDGGVHLRHVHLVAGEHRVRVQLRQRAGLLQQVLQLLVQLLVAQPATVLDLQAEAADGPQPLYRRRREDRDVGVLDIGELLVQLGGDFAGGHARPLALVEVLQRGEDDAAVRAVGEAVDRQPRERHGVLDARVLAGDFRHALDHRLGAVEGRRVGQLGEGHQVLLVLLRHEAGRRAGEAQPGQADQPAVDQQGNGAATQYAGDGADVAMAGAIEEAVERAEQPAAE
ncbi:hypothetical protein D3C78_904640 [compost metagenome]